MLINSSQSLTSFLSPGMENNATENTKKYALSGLTVIIPRTLGLLICLTGFLGNGIIIWLLGFRIKRNPFTIYILNLSIADFGVLIGQVIFNIEKILLYVHLIKYSRILNTMSRAIVFFTFFSSHLLLTVISIDRCVILYFPLWHRCHRPPHLSTAVCAIIWIFTFLISAIDTTLTFNHLKFRLRHYVFCSNVLLFMPIMCVSTLAMLIKVCLRSSQQKRGKVLRAILLTLIFFLLFTFPVNVIQSLSVFQKQNYNNYVYAYLCASLNSSINPVIYYWVGRDKRRRSSKKINNVLEKFFKEEEDYREEQDISAKTQDTPVPTRMELVEDCYRL